MNKVPLSKIKINILYGAIFLIPLAIMALLFAKLVEFLEGIAKALQFDSTWGAAMAVLVALAALLLLCFAVGVAVRTRLGGLSFGYIEKNMLMRLPGYQLISNVLKGFADRDEGYRPAMVSLHGSGTAVLGLVMEENENETVTVFVPSSPAMTVGTICIVKRDRIRLLEAGMIEVSNCVSHWGLGSRKLLGTTPLPCHRVSDEAHENSYH